MRGKSQESNVQDEALVMKEVVTSSESAWSAAIGFEEDDQSDFDRVWQKPLEAALSRSLSMPIGPRPCKDIFQMTTMSGFSAGCTRTSKDTCRQTRDPCGDTCDS